MEQMRAHRRLSIVSPRVECRGIERGDDRGRIQLSGHVRLEANKGGFCDLRLTAGHEDALNVIAGWIGRLRVGGRRSVRFTLAVVLVTTVLASRDGCVTARWPLGRVCMVCTAT